ncbi:Transcriptional regulatory protein PHO23 [Candida viswanathii]|uniref:Chromatin modification-related protein n=1 Tax=Candida viswanathii TaxID=5486 RepID=A0A367XMK4_9ASCO|nr:Transcriptional regulatory protein PHO23 [Candida viswanathii]
MSELPPREKSQRIINRSKQQHHGAHDSSGASVRETFQLYKNPPKVISNVNELLPGLNDISDAFEALPLDLIKYFTLLKEIDAKCINTIPQINQLISNYIDNLHQDSPAPPDSALANGTATNTSVESKKEEEEKKNKLESRRLTTIKNKINEIIPCLEEKMHVTSVASDLLNKHMIRINQDYKLILLNNEIPESIRIGPLNHPAMINDAANGNSNTTSNNGNSSQSQRSESRREALAAKKANKEDDQATSSKKKKKEKETSPNNDKSKKRGRDEAKSGNNGGSGNSSNSKKKKKQEDDGAKDGQSKSGNSSRTTNGSGSGGTDPTYCYCQQQSFGEMIGCDNNDCRYQWFHLPCIGLKNPPKGKWFCDDCKPL